MSQPGEADHATLRDRPAELLQRLIRFETVNPPGAERECVGWIEGLLRDAGLDTRVIASDDERPNLVARLPGSGAAPPLLLQGHVDVVPVSGQDWSRPPFAAEEADGFIWGRGTLDMKGGVAMMVAALLRAKEQGLEPRGDVLLCVVSDEEAGGDCGARFLVSDHAELFEGVRYALGEFGGFTLHAGGKRFAPISLSEKQVCWMRGRVRGPGGHASLPMRGGTMARLAEVLRRLDRKRLPVHVTPIVKRSLEELSAGMGPIGLPLRSLLVPALTDRVLDALGERAAMFDPALHNTVNATIVRGGDKVNVIPGEVELTFDARLLPGFTPDDLRTEVADLVGHDLEIEVDRFDEGGPAEPDMGLWDVLADALREGDPGVKPIPYLMPAVTDGRHFAQLGIQPYGFTPMRLPEGFEFTKLIHAADERIPTDAVEFGTEAFLRVLERF
jgi:acetylornithine deacetylase/succinyl-diaminopimelate desuccinylase-like protein